MYEAQQSRRLVTACTRVSSIRRAKPDIDPAASLLDLADEGSLRPRSFAEYVGQRRVVEKLEIYVAAARRRGEALDHCLFSGPPGLGKTSLRSEERRVGKDGRSPRLMRHTEQTRERDTNL